jgi:hypothetical protein
MSQSDWSRQEGQADAAVVSIKERSPLEQALQEGARQMLLQAIEAEVAEYVEAHRDEVWQRPAAGGAQRLCARAHPGDRSGNVRGEGTAGRG